MGARLISSALLVLVVGCGGSSEKTSKKETTTSKAPDRPKSKSGGYESTEPPKGKDWGGWRYRGERQDCFFRAGSSCFDTEEKACKAAKCGKKECVKDDGAPARVTCKEEK